MSDFLDPQSFECRRDQRLRLIAARRAMPPAVRARADAAIAAALDAWLLRHADPAALRAGIAVFWPIRGEPDLRSLWASWCARGHQLALPHVTDRQQGLSFLAWQPDAPMAPGAHGIPVPQGAASIHPRLLVVPCVGFFEDASGVPYRLGYGGGYYDRTLANPTLTAIGVAYATARVSDFLVQAHDRPLDSLITENTSI